MSRPEDFGAEINGSRWFNREPVVRTSEVKPIGYHWDCPMDGCEGEMRYTGMDWPTGQPGFHHKCGVCGFTAAIRGRRFPYVDYEEVHKIR